MFLLFFLETRSKPGSSPEKNSHLVFLSKSEWKWSAQTLRCKQLHRQYISQSTRCNVDSAGSLGPWCGDLWRLGGFGCNCAASLMCGALSPKKWTFRVQNLASTPAHTKHRGCMKVTGRGNLEKQDEESLKSVWVWYWCYCQTIKRCTLQAVLSCPSHGTLTLSLGVKFGRL